MKHITFFILFTFLGFLLLFGIRKYQVETMQKPMQNPISKQIPFSLDIPPKESLKATIISRTGNVFWEKRSASQASQLTQNIPILQGESVETKETGAISLAFTDITIITLGKNTTLHLIQTLPENIVVQQQDGEITYEVFKNDNPLAIRIDSLIVQVKKGNYTVSFDEKKNQIKITDIEGNATIAFNDVNLVSNVVSLTKDDIYTFDIDTKTGVINE